MGDLLGAFNGAIPVWALRSKVLHNRVNKLVPEKKVVNPVVKGGDSIVVEDLSDEPAPKENVAAKEVKTVDEPTSEVVKIETTEEEEVNEPEPVKSTKQKRKYRRRKSSTK